MHVIWSVSTEQISEEIHTPKNIILLKETEWIRHQDEAVKGCGNLQ